MNDNSPFNYSILLICRQTSRLRRKPNAVSIIVYGGDAQQPRQQTRVTSPQAFTSMLQAMEAELIENC